MGTPGKHDSLPLIFPGAEELFRKMKKFTLYQCPGLRYALCAMPYAIRPGPTFLWITLQLYYFVGSMGILNSPLSSNRSLTLGVPE